MKPTLTEKNLLRGSKFFPVRVDPNLGGKTRKNAEFVFLEKVLIHLKRSYLFPDAHWIIIRNPCVVMDEIGYHVIIMPYSSSTRSE